MRLHAPQVTRCENPLALSLEHKPEMSTSQKVL
jgi:hypothetical protein